MRRKHLLQMGLFAPILLAAMAIVGLDPSPLVLLRGSDFATLGDGAPKVAVEGAQRFESFKVTPAANYHSGRRNDVFYVSEDGARLILEYASTDRTQESLDVAWLLNHSFVVPRLFNAQSEHLSDGFVRVPLGAGGYVRLEFLVEGLREGMNDLHLVLDVRNDPLQAAGGEVVRFNPAHLAHMNVVLGSYGELPASSAVAPDASSALPQDAMVSELTVLARGNALAVVNPDERRLRAVISRPATAPEYISLAPRRAATYRERIREAGSVVVLLNPYGRLQDRWGNSSDSEDIAYTLRPSSRRAPEPLSLGGAGPPAHL